ncbi:MAG: oligosaccharide flippase family protein [Bacteroidetes bacterium]|nr:oligosaccharide flippase family protein [Bacteroidota bacterium]MBS1671539.1 oligosaccharide flippase family protein [Bacteroidota bacterium]
MSLNLALQQSLKWRSFYLITTLLLNICIARFLGASKSSILFYLSNVFALVLLVASISIESALTYFSSNKKINTNKLAWFGLLCVTLVAVIVFILLPIYFVEFEKLTNTEKLLYRNWGLLYITGVLLINFYSGLYYADNNFFTPNLVCAILNIALIVTIVAVSEINTNSNFLISNYFLLSFVQGIIIMFSFFISSKAYQLVQLPNSVERKLLFGYASNALLANIIFFLVYRVDYWFVKNNCSTEDAGNYMQAARFGQLLWLVPQILATAIFPKTAANINEGEVEKTIVRLSRIFVQCFLVFFILILLFGKIIFPFLLGNSFNTLYKVLLILIPGVLALSILSLLSAYFAGINKIKINISGAFSGLLTVLLLSIILLHWYNIYIAALISSIGYFVCLAYAVRVFRLSHFFSFRSLIIPNKEDWKWLISLILKKPNLL